jgi:uncharacterized protein (DUF2141 family)
VSRHTALAILAASVLVIPCAQVGFPQSAKRVPLADSPSGPQTGCTLRIHVDGFRNTRGNLGTVVFKSPDGWPEDFAKAVRTGPAPIDEATGTAIAVWPVPPGDYAVAAIHDENSNARLDRNFLGIPKEGFGFANNPHISFGAAPFRAAQVHVVCPATEITIHLQYR